MKLYCYRREAPRFSQFRFRSWARELIAAHVPTQSPEPLGARVMYKVGTKSPLGDFPYSDEGLIVSARAYQYMAHYLDEFFQMAPIRLESGGCIKRSLNWEKTDIPPHIPPDSEYYFAHPFQTLLPNQDIPIPIEEASPTAFEELDLEQLARAASNANTGHKSELDSLANYFEHRNIPPIFNFEKWAVTYYTEEFLELAKKHNLKGIKLIELGSISNI